MFKNLYEYEKDNRNIYDEVRQYCMAEHLNEEYLRDSIIKIKKAPIKRSLKYNFR